MSENGYIKGGSFLIEKVPPAEVITPEDMTDEHRMIRQTTQDFVEKDIWPKREQIENKDKEVFRSLLLKAGELGLNATDIPEAYGGLGLDKVSTAVVTEALGAAGSFAVAHGAHTGIGTLPLVFFGNEAQKQKYLPGLATGEICGAYALTEPSAGSDALGGCKTKAVLAEDNKHYILNGQKIFITNAGWADLFITYAKIDGDKFTAFIIERETEGLSVGPEEKKMGIHGSSTCSLILEEAKIPVENVLHQIGKGHHVAFNILNVGRYKLGAATIGGSKLCLKNSVQYAKVREQFNTPICQFGMIKEKLADAAIKIYMNESIIHRIAGLFESILGDLAADDPEYGLKAAEAIREYAIECSIAKVFGSEALDFVVDEGVQILGGYGYIDEYPAEGAYRDARINRIFEGTNEVNRLIIPGELMQRAMKGKLPLLAAAQNLMQEVLTFSPLAVELPDTPLAVQEHMVEMSKKVALLVAGVAAQKFMDKLINEQEVLARIADIVIEVFVMESGLLRAQKVLEIQGEEKAKYHLAMVQAYVDDTLPRIETWAKKALAYIEEGDTLRTQLSALRKFTRYQPLDAVTLKRTIADRVIEREEYPL